MPVDGSTRTSCGASADATAASSPDRAESERCWREADAVRIVTWRREDVNFDVEAARRARRSQRHGSCRGFIERRSSRSSRHPGSSSRSADAWTRARRHGASGARDGRAGSSWSTAGRRRGPVLAHRVRPTWRACCRPACRSGSRRRRGPGAPAAAGRRGAARLLPPAARAIEAVGRRGRSSSTAWRAPTARARVTRCAGPLRRPASSSSPPSPPARRRPPAATPRSPRRPR